MEAVIETGRSSCTMVDVLEEMGVLASHHHREEIWFSAPLTAGSFFASLIPSNHRKEASVKMINNVKDGCEERGGDARKPFRPRSQENGSAGED